MRGIYLITLFWLSIQPVMAVEVPAVLRECLARNLPESTSIQAVELRARDRTGYESILQANVYLKRLDDGQTRLMMHFKEPMDVRGARFLIIQQEPQNAMYIYMPGLFKVREITSRNISNSVLGTDFSYEDFERLYGIFNDLKATQLEDAVLAGRPVHVINSYPDTGSDYKKIESYFDSESCIPLRVDLYGGNDRLRKTLTVDPARIETADDIHYPGEMVMRDLRENTETRLNVQSFKADVPLDDDLFNPDRLKKADIPAIPAE